MMKNDPTKEIRKKYAPVFRLLTRKGPVQAGITLGVHLFLIIISIVAGALSLHASTPLTHITTVVLSIFIATRLRGINNIVHECMPCLIHAFKKMERHLWLRGGRHPDEVIPDVST